MTHTKSNIIQYNEYYPFGLQTSNSWTRENSANNFLYNSGSELNNTTRIYETMFRGYDATLGRFMQVDPLAHWDASTSPFAYAGNNPVMFNDPLGLLVSVAGYSDYQIRTMYRNDFYNHGYSGSFGDWAQDNLDFGGVGSDRTVRGTDGHEYGVNRYGQTGYWVNQNYYDYSTNVGLDADGNKTPTLNVTTRFISLQQQTQGGPRVIMGLDGNVTRFDDGANLIY